MMLSQRFGKWALLALCLVLTMRAHAVGSPESPPGPARPTNLLLIVTDDQSAFTLGIAGDAHGATPNLDALAQGGVSFDRAYCNSPLCTPSRQSFITGKLPHATGVTRLLTPLPEGARTLGHILGERGYRTAAIGKMHFNGESNHGFELRRDVPDWLRHLEVHPPAGGDRRRPWRPFVDPPDVWLNAGVQDYGLDEESMDATYFVNRSIRFIKEDPDRPFALVVGFYEPHAPFAFPRGWRARYRADQCAGPSFAEQDRVEQPEVFRRLSDAQFRGVAAAYYTSLSFVDAQIGRLVRAVDDAGIGADTLVVILGDNGYMLGQHGRLEKHCFYEPAVRVPLILRQPGRIPAGRRTSELVELVDVLPTALGLMGEPIPAGLHGRDLSALALGRPGSVGRATIVGEYSDSEEAMARSARYKLVVGSGRRRRTDGYQTGRPPGGPYERLFDEQDDPDETRDLSADPRFTAVKETLWDALYRRLTTTWVGPEPLPPGLSRQEAVFWCLTPRDRGSNGRAGS